MFRKSAVVLSTFLLILISCISVCAEGYEGFDTLPNFEKWNQCDLYSVLEDSTDSNSAYDCIIMRVDRDAKTYQLHMLIMAELKQVNDITKAGVRLSFNSIGTVELFVDGRTNYNSNLFFGEMENCYVEKSSNDIWMEVTVGIKSGIPDRLIVGVSLYDTDGIISNTYPVDISAASDEADNGNASPDGDELRTTKTAKNKTVKVKTSKAKTVKYKTFKSSKGKTAKNGKASYNEYNATDKNGKYVIEDNGEYYDNDDNNESSAARLSIGSDEFEDVKASDEKNKLIYICAAAVIACAAGGCAAGIINNRKKNNSKGDE